MCIESQIFCCVHRISQILSLQRSDTIVPARAHHIGGGGQRQRRQGGEGGQRQRRGGEGGDRSDRIVPARGHHIGLEIAN